MQQLGPDTILHVYELLRNAQSSLTATQKDSEAALAQLEGQQGFCSCLAVNDVEANLRTAWKEVFLVVEVRASACKCTCRR